MTKTKTAQKTAQINQNHWIFSHPIEQLIKQFGSPLYLYNLSVIRAQCQQLRQAFGSETDIFYAVKANANPEILKMLQQEALVDGLDVASQGEYEMALASKWLPEQLSYTGPAKTKQELTRIIEQKIGAICVESPLELARINTIAKQTPHKQPKLMFRINPKEEIHAFGLKTSGTPSPFGFDEEQLPELFQLLRQNKGEYEFVGLHIHAGSQCFSAKALARNFTKIFELVMQFEENGFRVKQLNVGGGFGIATWSEGKELSIHGVAQHLRRIASENEATRKSDQISHQVRIEPGRFIMAPAGVYIAQVVSQKQSRGQLFSMIDGGLNHLFEAAHTAAHFPKKQYQILNLTHPNAALQKTNISGSLCTPRDKLAQGIMLPTPQIGDLLGWPNTGAYGFSASPLLFLGHPTPAEVLYNGKEYRLIRKKLSLLDFH